MRKLPPLNAVRAFEAAARHVSFTKAADELHVTHGAVSRQVALLEDWFGIKLFRRTPSQLSLTDAGQLYAREVTAILDRLALASLGMKEDVTPTVLRVNAPPTFTMQWFIRRMSEFQQQHANVELRLTTALGPVNANEAGFEIAIRSEQDILPGWTSVQFMTELIAPVCHADVLKKGQFKTPSDLQQHKLITYLTEPYGWSQWFEAAGGQMSRDQGVLRFEQMYLALQAAEEGMGVGLFPLFLVIDDLMSRKMSVPFGVLGMRKRAYSVLFRTDVAEWPVIGEFCNWLVDAGHQTELATQAWAQSIGWDF